MKPSLVLLGLGFLVVGCDSNVEVQGDGGGSDVPAGIEGEWIGYVESFKFEDGSDVVALSLDSVAANAIVGHVTFGARPLYAPASDPNVGYPPGYLGHSEGPLSGFSFTILDGSFDGQRLRLSISSREVWSGWCALQTPIADESNPGMYWCLPNWGYSGGETCTQPNPETGEDVVVDCGKLSLCMEGPVCTCDAVGCAAYEGADIAFDIQIEGFEAEGSATGLSDTPRNVFLEQQ